jgi:predicted Rossmann fold flavoprotein
MQWEVVVVGGGAAGLLAAAHAAERGRGTLLLEKNRKTGAKILMSGGTRCNITHDTDAEGIVSAFGKPGRFLYSPLAALGPNEVVALIESEGVPTKVEPGGKIFPESDRASDVLAALWRRLQRSRCEVALSEPLVNLTRSSGGFELTTSKRVLSSATVIVTTGGQSYPGCGTTGDGYGWLAAMGHTIVPPRPALTPVTTAAAWVSTLRGVTIPDVEVRVMAADTMDSLSRARGSFLFTHFGLSGPAVLNVSRAVSGHARPADLRLECDFLPAMRREELEHQFGRAFVAEGRKQVESIVANWLPRRLAEAFTAHVGISGRLASEVSRHERLSLAVALKSTQIPVSGTRGFKKAEVTAGGVALSEVDSRTMQSKLVPGLFLAGEILDLDGPIGGYNFQAAFSTGWLAGGHA